MKKSHKDSQHEEAYRRQQEEKIKRPQTTARWSPRTTAGCATPFRLNRGGELLEPRFIIGLITCQFESQSSRTIIVLYDRIA